MFSATCVSEVFVIRVGTLVTRARHCVRILEELTSEVRFYLVYETCRGFLQERKIRTSWTNPRVENDKQTLLTVSKGGVIFS
jgi:hypothetical protein